MKYKIIAKERNLVLEFTVEAKDLMEAKTKAYEKLRADKFNATVTKITEVK